MRLFLAVNLDGAVRRAIYRDAEPLRRAVNGVVWVREELLHLTLKFLGERPEREAAGFAKLAEEIAFRHRCVHFTMSGIGAFPNLDRPRVVWMGARGADALGVISEHIDRAFEELGVPREERQFRPHLTLGRVKGELNERERTPLATAIPLVRERHHVEVASVDLMQSELSARGPTYTLLARAALAGS